ncbi:fibronectin type III domain-containing protein [Marinobacter sp. 1-3A]|uniref:fibronectin type III domain-containing protein n=1 Tax=Marinobacter sp. 1-3A TaxID=2582920 RepID=UPI001D10AD12|nr:fibronectin type III domain-containing protein [Marinobacter sp. 1-3A]
MPFITSTRLSLFTIALSTLLTACGGGDSSAPLSQSPDVPVTTPGGSLSPEEATETKFWVEGYAVKGAIDGGRVSIWHYEQGTMGRDWVQISETTRTNELGGFRISVPEIYASQPLKVVLQSDTQTLMRCDVQPTCTTPLDKTVAFGSWFQPGNNLELKSLVVPSSASQGVALTPLVTLAFEKFIKSKDISASRFTEILHSQEERFGLANGALSIRPIDLAAPDLKSVQAAELKTALLNTAFLSLVDGQDWNTLGDVLHTANEISGANGDLPLNADSNPELNVALLVGAGLLQAERLSDYLQDAGVPKGVLAQTIVSLEETLASIMPAPEPQPQPEPDPLPEPTPEPEPQPEPEPLPEPTPEPEPQPEPEPAPQPEPTPEPEPEPEPAPTPDPEPTPEPEPVIGNAKMSWNAPGTRVNGESLAMGEIDSYIVKYGTEQNVEDRTHEIVVEDGQAMEYQVAGLTEGTWYFAIKTVDTNGLESDWSVSVSKTISR